MTERITVGILAGFILWVCDRYRLDKARSGRIAPPKLDAKSRVIAALFLVPVATLHLALAQMPETPPSLVTPIAASSATEVPMLVRYDGAAIQSDGKPRIGASPVTFLVYKEEQGGEPLWTETQSVTFDPNGKYEVYLGSTRSSGLPADLFGSGEARWLEVQVTGEPVRARNLLVSVPYALHAADASTLGGLPASAFMRASPQSATSLAASDAITAAASSTVTTPAGTAGLVPVFTGTSTIGNSILYASSTGLGIGLAPSSYGVLDVGGESIFRGALDVSRIGNASASAGTNSNPLLFNFQYYNSAAKFVYNPYFSFQAEVIGNNTANPAGTMNFLYYNGIGGVPKETGLFFNTDGTIHFAPNQTFPTTSTSGTPLSGVSSSGIGVQGTSTAGTGVQGVSSSSYGVEGTSITAPGVLGYTVGGTANTSGVVGQVGSLSGMTGISGVRGDSAAQTGVLGTSSTSTGVVGISNSGIGVQGSSSSTYGIFGASVNSTGVLGYTGGGTLNTAGVIGRVASGSGFTGIAGVWGDSSTHAGVFGSSSQYAGVIGFSTSAAAVQGIGTNGPGVQGTSANSYAGYFAGGTSLATVYATNTASTGGSSLYGASSGTNGVGVYGSGSGSGGSGIQGVANAGNGVVGISQQVGVYGIGGSTDTSFASATYELGSGPFGVWGDVTGSSNIGAEGVVATASNSSAGIMTNNSAYTTLELDNFSENGNTLIDGAFRVLQASTPNGSCGFGGNGDMICTGQMKSLATTSSGSRTVETYSMQSPENWMEDFGSGSLQNGVATISVDSAFAETVSGTADYHVFLTPRGDSKGLYVTNTTATSFEVHESGGGTSSLAFDYRIVAKRRGFEKQRMVDVTEAMKASRAQFEKRKLMYPVAHK